MKIFENINTAPYTYLVAKQKELTHPKDGELYQKVGKSFSPIGWDSRLVRSVQLIGLVAVGIFLFPFTAYRKLLNRVYNETTTGKEKNIHYIPLQRASKIQSEMLDNLTGNIKARISELNVGPFQAAQCYILLEGYKGQIKKEFIFKSLAGNFQEFDTMKEKLKQQLYQTIGASKEFKCQMIFKNAAGQFSSADYTCRSPNGGIGGASTSISTATLQRIHDEMGFPKVIHHQNGDFVPGPLYQAL